MSEANSMRTLSAGGGQVAWAANLQGCVDNHTDYLIVAADRFCSGADKAVLDSFANFRADSTGFNVSIVNIKNIDTTDVALRNFIKNLYDSRSAAHWWDGHLGFVALVGDYRDPDGATLIPIHLQPSHAPDPPLPYFASDNWFAAVAGDTVHPALMLGRISVDNGVELGNVVDKILAYEPLPDGPGWSTRVFLTAGTAEPQNRAADSTLVDEAFDNLSAIIEGDGFDVSVLRGDTLGPPYPDLTAMNADALAQGWFFVDYAIHGDPCDMGWLVPRSFTACSVETLANDGMPCVFTAFGCQTGRFDTERTCGPCSTSSYDCIGERLVNIADAGAIAFIGLTDEGTTSQFGSMDLDLYDAVFRWHDPVLGMAFDEMLLRQENTERISRLVLLGDPALRIGYREALRGKCDLWVRNDPDLPPGIWFDPPIDTIPAPDSSDLRVAIRNLTDVDLSIPPPSQAVAVQFWIKTWDEQWVLLGVDSVRTVNAWDSTTAEVVFHPLDYAMGEYDFRVVVDPAGVLEEAHEDNNSAETSEWVGFPPSEGTLPSVPSDEPTLAYLNDGPYYWQHYVLFPCVDSWLYAADGGGHVSTELKFRAADGPLHSPAVGDLNNDGRTLVIVCSQHKVSCVDLFMPDSLRVQWARDFGDTLVATPPCVVDLDGDNHLEVVVGAKTADGDSGFVFRLDGGMTLGPVTRLGERVPSCPLAATDLNDDGRYDVLVGTDKNSIVGIDGSSGAIFAENQVVCMDTAIVAVEGLAVGDLDFNGRAEVVAGGTRYLRTFAADTTLAALKCAKLQKSAGISGISIADVVDYADTAALEIVVSDVTTAGSARVSVYDAVHYSSLVSDVGIVFSGEDQISVPVIGDLHTAPGAEIVFFTTEGDTVSSMRVWNATDNTIVSFMNDLAGPVASGVLCDFDGDGLPQILFASSGDRHVWSATANGRATSIMWPTSLGDERGRNVYAVALHDTLPAADLTLWGRYTVSGTVWTGQYNTLTLSPGTEMRFVPSDEDPPYLVCRGPLRAIGREDAPIVFTSADPTPSPGDWASLYLDHNAPAAWRDSVEHCVLEYGTIGLDVAGSGGEHHFVTSVRSSCLRYNGTYGANISREGVATFDTLRIDDCEFLDNRVGGVHVHRGFLDLRHSRFVKDDSLNCGQTYGVFVEGAAAGCIIDNNYLNAGSNPPSDTSYWDYGVVLQGPWVWCDRIVRRNYIESFYQAGIEVSDVVAPSVTYVDSNCVRSGIADSLPTTLVGMRFTEPEGRGTGAAHVRLNAVYQTYLGVYASSHPLPVLGDTSLFDGLNNLAGNTYYVQSASPDPNDTLKAEMCWWGDQPDTTKFIGLVDYTPQANMPSGTPGADNLPTALVCALSQAYPNPLVAGEARIKFSVDTECQARIEVFNVLGQRVRCLQSGNLAPGPHEVFWDGTAESGRAIAAGVYFYRLETPHFRATKKMVVLN